MESHAHAFMVSRYRCLKDMTAESSITESFRKLRLMNAYEYVPISFESKSGTSKIGKINKISRGNYNLCHSSACKILRAFSSDVVGGRYFDLTPTRSKSALSKYFPAIVMDICIENVDALVDALGTSRKSIIPTHTDRVLRSHDGGNGEIGSVDKSGGEENGPTHQNWTLSRALPTIRPILMKMYGINIKRVKSGGEVTYVLEMEGFEWCGFRYVPMPITPR